MASSWGASTSFGACKASSPCAEVNDVATAQSNFSAAASYIGIPIIISEAPTSGYIIAGYDGIDADGARTLKLNLGP